MENNFRKDGIPFTQVPNGLLYNPTISFKAKGLWAYMNAKPDGWNFSADRIATETKEERKSILAGLKELSENGYITAKKLGSGRIEYTLHYEVAITSKPESEPTTESKDSNLQPRPFRKNFDSDEEFEKALYNWSHRVYNEDSKA